MSAIISGMPKEKSEKDKPRKRPKPKEDCAEDEVEEEPPLKPVDFKIGEDSDNLKQREDWFQKRHK